LQRKEDEELLQLFVLFLSVGNVLYYISKTVLKNTLHMSYLFFYHYSKMQMSPFEPSLMMRSSVSASFARDSSGICASFALTPSPISS